MNGQLKTIEKERSRSVRQSKNKGERQYFFDTNMSNQCFIDSCKADKHMNYQDVSKNKDLFLNPVVRSGCVPLIGQVKEALSFNHQPLNGAENHE